MILSGVLFNSVALKKCCKKPYHCARLNDDWNRFLKLSGVYAVTIVVVLLCYILFCHVERSETSMFVVFEILPSLRSVRMTLKSLYEGF